MENNKYPKDLISASDITKNHRYDDFGMRKQSTRRQNTKISENKTRAERRERKRQKKNPKQVSHRKVDLKKIHAISMEILDIFCPAVLKQYLIQNINKHPKQKQNIYVLSHRRLNSNLETKNHN